MYTWLQWAFVYTRYITLEILKRQTTQGREKNWMIKLHFKSILHRLSLSYCKLQKPSKTHVHNLTIFTTKKKLISLKSKRIYNKTSFQTNQSNTRHYSQFHNTACWKVIIDLLCIDKYLRPRKYRPHVFQRACMTANSHFPANHIWLYSSIPMYAI